MTARLNEYSVMVQLMTRRGRPMGAAIDDLLNALGYPESAGRGVLFHKMAALHKLLRPLGLALRYNPVDAVFYIDVTGPETLPSRGILSDRLAATLLVVITLSCQEGGWVPIKRVRSLRRKTLRGLMTDLRELESMGYVEFDQSGKSVRPGVRVPFEIDYEGFFRQLSSTEEHIE
ncbi:MAG: hypothetical protein ACTSPE_06560 [Candidatus Thorarchaeota archaeon]